MIELKNLEPFGSLNDDVCAFGYDPTSDKYGKISVAQIHRDTWCGCRWRISDTTTVGEPVGSLTKLANMQSVFGLGGYLVKNNHDRMKLSETDHSKYANGTTAPLDGSAGHYQWGSGRDIYYASWNDGVYEYEAIDIQPIPGHLNIKFPVFSRSAAGFATIDRTNLILCSYINSAAQYRGGNNNSALDSAFNSQLGKPATNISAQTAATYARKNGTLWFCNERAVFFITGAIKRIFFHDRNIQKGYTSTLTSAGLHQGGTGMGADLPADWSGAWGYYPYLPLSAGLSMGDSIGTFSQSINDNGTTKNIGNIPCFMGLKNDYKYLGAICEDILLNCNADKSQSVYIDHNIDGHAFDYSTVSGHTLIGNTPAVSSANWYFIMKNNLEYACDFPTKIRASSTTGYGDGYYNPAATSGLRGASRLGRADDGDHAGSVYLDGRDAPAAASAYYGVVLCELREAMSTKPEWVS